ncbi:MAG TPA: ACP phosphodiesterase [Cyclobacteriaceae bacterium]|nr:ACP phosphodiesterase [Cyclobacteriaceae bacterium]
MNFLAHLYLSGDRSRVMVGNFIGDFVKGRNLAGRYEPDVVMGIELHRAIDHFTDTHQTVSQSKKRLAGKYRHYSGVIVDVFYDHFLSSKWSEYHHETIGDFAQAAYKLLQDNDPILPEEVKIILPHMIRQNWLVAYGEISGIQQALNGISRRTPYVSNMEKATTDLREHYEEFASDFAAFFPQLRDFAKEYIRSRYL